MVCFAPVVGACTGNRKESAPNIIVIIADDQGWGDLSFHGNANLKTPNIDALANDGASFDRFFVCPVSAPTRAELFTGRYHIHSNVTGVTNGKERMSLEEKTVADMFRAAGYATALFGKWHNGSQYPYHPTGRGFQEFFGFTSGHWGNYINPILEDNGKMVREKGYITDILTDRTISYIEKNRDKPFFCCLALNTPHSPFQVPDEYWDRFSDAPITMRGRQGDKEDLPTTRCALAMCENIDRNVGRLLKKINELNISQNTIVIYMSDNGPNGIRWNGDMKGIKGSVDEGGVRVPFFIRWTGKIPSGTRVSAISGAIDLLPTLAALANVEPTGILPLDGIDVSPWLFGKGKDRTDRTIVSQKDRLLSVRSQQYRYVEEDNQLFDMIADPGQYENIADKKPEVRNQLVKALEDWKKSTNFDIEREIPPIPVGYSGFPWTPLPARDAVLNGTVRRSSIHANCSYITNWTSSEDKISWDIDVHTDGEYIVAIHYTCPESDSGSEIELRCGDRTLLAKIVEPFDAPLFDQTDRVLRKESYVKDFKEMSLGKIYLKKGLATLELRASKIFGKQVADFWGFSLTLSEK